MGIFRHRPLFLWCAAFTAAAAGGYLLFDACRIPKVSPWVVFLCISVGTVATGLTAYGILYRRLGKRRALAIWLAFVTAILGFTQSFMTFAGRSARAWKEWEGEAVSVVATVTERRGEGGYLSSFALELYEIDGVAVDGAAVLTCHYLADLSVGDRVNLRATVISLEESAGDRYSAGPLRGDGYVVGLLSESERDVTMVGRDADVWAVRAGRMRRNLVARLNLLCGREASGLPSAFLLGDRAALRSEVQRDFARAGVSHLLAISGLHMTLLFGLLEGVLRLLRFPKRWRALLLGASAVGYLMLLGFPPSATRAVIMLGMVYLSVLLFAHADSLTSLGVAGVLILSVSPHAAADAGFWMSYLATLGLVSVMPWVNTRADRWRTCAPERRIRTYACALMLKVGVGLLVGVVAMFCTLALVAAVMGEMGILSPVATLILTPLCGVILLLSPLALLLSGTGLGLWLGRLIASICSLMADMTAWMAEPRWTVVSLVHPLILPIAVLMMVAWLVLLVVRLPERRRWVLMLPLLVSWGLIGTVLTVSDHTDDDVPAVSYLQPSSQSDMLVLTEGRDAVICDLSNGSLSSLTAASTEASRRGATEMAALMLTHYHRRTVGALGEFLARETVREIWLPLPTSEADYNFLLAYIEKATDADVPIVLYEPGEALRIFNRCTLTLYTASLERSVQPVLLLSLDTDPLPDREGELIYCGSAVFESDLSDRAAEMVASADAVIFGNHGPLVKKPFGENLIFREHVRIVLSEKGDISAYFRPMNVPDGSGTALESPVWLGQWRFEWQKKSQ